MLFLSFVSSDDRMIYVTFCVKIFFVFPPSPPMPWGNVSLSFMTYKGLSLVEFLFFFFQFSPLFGYFAISGWKLHGTVDTRYLLTAPMVTSADGDSPAVAVAVHSFTLHGVEHRFSCA